MTVESSLANISIRNNTMDQGMSSDGTLNTTYTYANHALISGSSNIVGNTFSGPTASVDMVNIDECSCTITNNKFIRGSTVITAYIRSTGANDQVITDNIFDGYTTDDLVDDIIVKGLSNQSVYHSNKNQIIYVPVVWFDSVVDIPSAATDTIFGFGSFTLTNPNIVRSNSYLSYTRTNATNSSLVVMIPLRESVPDGAILMEAKIGLTTSATGVTFTGDNTFSMILNAQETLSANYSAGTGSILDVFNRRTTVAQTVTSTYDMATNTAILQAASQYVSVAPTLDYFTNNGRTAFSLFMSCKIQLSVVTSLTHRFSPVVLKCRW